jgi:hypothetical protein
VCSAYGVDRGVQFLCALAGRAAQLLQAVHDGRVLRLFGLVQQLFGGFVDRRTRGHGRSDCPLKPGAFIVEPLRFGVIAGHYGSGSPPAVADNSMFRVFSRSSSAVAWSAMG